MPQFECRVLVEHSEVATTIGAKRPRHFEPAGGEGDGWLQTKLAVRAVSVRGDPSSDYL